MSDSAEPKPAPVKSGSKPPKSLLVLLVLNLGASGFTTFKVATTPPAAAASHEQAAPPTNPTEVTGPVIGLDPFVVNLDEPGQSRYLKLTLQLELVAAEAQESLDRSKQLIRDTFLSYLSGLHHADTLGAAAKDKLRVDLMSKIEKILGPNKVRRMFFQEFVVQ